MSDIYAQPRDVWAERATVGALLAHETIPADTVVTASNFWDPHLAAVATACLTLNAQGKPCDPIAVRCELLRSGRREIVTDPIWLLNLLHDGCTLGSLSHHTKTLRELAVRRRVMVAADRALQAAASPGISPFDTAAVLHVEAGNLADEGDPIRPLATVDATDFIIGNDAYDWLVPGLFERGDRFLITGHEGSGKSVLSRMLAITTAAGVHPFKGDRVPPARVLLVDFENGTRHLRRALRGLWDHATLIGRPIERGNLTVESRPSGIDLTRGDDQQWLTQLCDSVRPEMLVIGPLYRMHAADMNAEEPARHLTRTIDLIRANHNCVVIMETHAPHGQSGAQRTLRPVGSSLFMRWPEFGYGLRPSGEEGHTMSLVAWRGPRDERDFPHTLIRGGPQEWPWAESKFKSAWAS